MTAFAGVVLLLFWNNIFGTGSEAFSIDIGILWMFLCALVFAAYNVLNRMLTEKGYTAMEIATWSAVFGAIEMLGFLPGTIHEVAAATAGANMAAIYLGVFPSALAYYLWSKSFCSYRAYQRGYKLPVYKPSDCNCNSADTAS